MAPACVVPSMTSGSVMPGSAEAGLMVFTALLPPVMANRIRSPAGSALASMIAARRVHTVVELLAVTSQMPSPTVRSGLSLAELTT